MFKRPLVSTALSVLACATLITAQASAAVRTTSGTSSTLTVGSAPLSYGSVSAECVAAGEMGPGFRLGFSNELPGLTFLGDATVTFDGVWTGDTTPKTVVKNADGLGYEPSNMPTCGVGGSVRISGFTIRYLGGVTADQTHLAVRPKSGETTVIVARNIALSGMAQQQAVFPSAATVTGVQIGEAAPTDGTFDVVSVTFDRDIATSTTSISDWTLDDGSFDGLHLDHVIGVIGKTVYLSVKGYAGTGDSTPSHGGTRARLSLKENNSLRTTTGGSVTSFSGREVMDVATPTIKSAVLSDTNGNGRYDAVTLTFTENVVNATENSGLSLAVVRSAFSVYDASGSSLEVLSYSNEFGTQLTINFADAAEIGSGTNLPRIVFAGSPFLHDTESIALQPGTVSKTSSDRYPVLVGPILSVPPATVPQPVPTPSNNDIGYPSIRINNQANYTKTQSVTLDLSASNATQMQIGNTSNLSSAAWMDYTSSKSWTLTSGKGTKTVCVRFRNATKTSTTECDTILFDSSAKEPTSMSVVINKGNSNTTSTLVTLTLKATNASEMRMNNSPDMSGVNWIPYKTSAVWNIVGGSGDRTVYVQFRSSALIESNVVSDVITFGYPYTVQNQVLYSGLTAGDLIKLPNDGNPETSHDQTVYYFGADGKRHAFPSQKVYESWFVGFGSVKIVSMDTLASIPLGMPMLVRPGTYLVKSPSMNRVYVVTLGGVLRPLKNEAAAIKHFGKGWGSRVIDLSDGFFASYTTTNNSEYSESAAYPDGTVVEASGVRWYVESGDLYPFAANGFSDNGFQDKFVVKLEKKPNYSTKSSINGRTDKHSKFYYRDANGSLVGV